MILFHTILAIAIVTGIVHAIEREFTRVVAEETMQSWLDRGYIL